MAGHYDLALYLKAVHHTTMLGDLLKDDFKTRAFVLLRGAIKTMKADTSPDQVVADLYYFGGDWFRRLALQPDSSLLCFQRALEIRTKLFGTESEEVAACLFGLGDNYKYSLYDFNAAERCYEKALEIREGLHTKDEFQLARTYFNLATTNRSQGDFEKAISYGYHTIEIVHKMDDGLFLEATYSIIGNIYRDMGQYDSARHLYELAIGLNKRNNDNQQNEALATLYQGLGAVLKEESQYDEAISNYQRGLKIYFDMDVKGKIILVHCLQQLGEIYVIKKQPVQAMRLYRQALSIQNKFNLSKGGSAAGLYKSLGDLFLKENLFDSALVFYQKSLISAVPGFNAREFQANPDLASVELKVFVYATLIGKAEALMHYFRQTKNGSYATTALACYALAEKLLVASRNSLDREESKWAFLDVNFELYDQSVETIYELSGYPFLDSMTQAAFFYFESGKSRSLADALQVAAYSNKALFTDSLIQDRNNYKMGLFTLQDQLKKVANPEQIQMIRNAIVEIDRKLNLNENEIRKRYPSFFDIRNVFPTPAMAEVQRIVDKEKAVLIEYFWGKRFVYAMGITNEQVVFKRIGVTDSLNSRIRDLISLLQPEGSSLDLVSYQSFVQTSSELYEFLLGPFKTLMDHKDRIVIVPDGLVGQVPFEVLITQPARKFPVDYKDLAYLIKSHIIDYAFSASFFLRQADQVVANPRLLAFGLTGAKSVRSGPVKFNSDLGGAALELACLERHFPTGAFYLGDQAKKRDFLNKAPEYDLIHLAIHGQGDTERNYAASLFFKNTNDTIDDGELHWYELYGLRLKAALVVLSSCESGIGKSYKGEGMLSMANAFAYSGCRNLLLGLWKVNDQTSVQLMDKFYEGILSGKRVDDALATAKRDYLAGADELSAHPKMWGALVAFGDLQVIEKEKGQWIYFSIALVITLLGIGILVKNRN